MFLVFRPTKKIGEYIEIDENRKRFRVNGGEVMAYEDLLSFELFENNNSVAKGGLGRAMVGGLLFGSAGAIVGGLTRKQQNLCSSMVIHLTFRSAVASADIRLVTSPIKTDSITYRACQINAQNILSELQRIADEARRQQAAAESAAAAAPAAVSCADEILKLKQLADAGIITQEEFERKKVKLLDL